MPIHVLTIPFDPSLGTFDDESVAQFLVNKRVQRLEPAFFVHEGAAYWSVYVEYEPILSTDEKPAHKPSLNKNQAAFLTKLRQWRKERADKDGIPVFIVATNAHLDQVIIKQPQTLEALRQIDGFGKKKLEAYGRDILKLVNTFCSSNTNTTNQPITPPTKTEDKTLNTKQTQEEKS